MWSVNARAVRPLDDRLHARRLADRRVVRRSPTTLVREFPSTGPADVDFAGGTVLAAGNTGLVLNSTDGVNFFYNDAAGRSRRSAGTRSASPARLTARSAATTASSRSTTAANTHPRAARPPRRRRRSPACGAPINRPAARRTAPAADLHAHRHGNGATREVSGGKVKIVVKGKIKVPSGVSAKTACTGRCCSRSRRARSS